MVLNNLGIFYAKKNDYGRALDYWNRSLTIEPHQPQIRDAPNAAGSTVMHVSQHVLVPHGASGANATPGRPPSASR